MKFNKFFCAGKDYIFLSEENSFSEIEKLDIRLLCDRQRGIGADGIFALKQNNSKNSQIRGFLQNGEIMRDYSTASICAAFAINSNESFGECVFSCENNEFFTLFSDSGGKNPLVSCDLGKGNFDIRHPAIMRKTEIGNRILTLTALELHGIHTVHFSENKDNLDTEYFGSRISVNSLFGKKADFIIAQRFSKNSFDINYYENKTGNPRPTVSAFAATALAACKTGKANYNEEMRVTCNNNTVYVFCREDNSVVIQCTATRIFEGEI
ncbi:MAG: hypothetical protein IKL10_01875 [Clostridia bacterium]|nr:hypothetical protein [Clostridia bacterium]